MEGIGVLIAIMYAALIGPPLIFLIIGLSKRKSNPVKAKPFFILAVVYLLIGGGICASLLI